MPSKRKRSENTDAKPSGHGHFMYKQRLQNFTQKSSVSQPMYLTVNEGHSRAPKFRSRVIVNEICYVSGETFSNKLTAEEDVARYALECIEKKTKDEGCPLIPEGVLCKSILNTFTAKMNLEVPTYNTIELKELIPLYASSLVFNGVTYSGEPGGTKKEAERSAARAVILSTLDDPRYATCFSELIQTASKKVKDSSVSDLGTTPDQADMLIHSNQEVETAAGSNKEVETAAASNSVPNGAIVQPSSGAESPDHKVKIIKLDQDPECVDLPISCVPPVLAHSSDVGENPSGKQSNKKKKKKRAKLDTDTKQVTLT